MIVENQLDCGAAWIGGIRDVEECDELWTAVAVLPRAWTLPVSRSIPAKELKRGPKPLRSPGAQRALVLWGPAFPLNFPSPDTPTIQVVAETAGGPRALGV